MRRVGLGVRTFGCPVENVVGRELHQLRVQLAASHRDIPHRQRVGEERGDRLLFGDVYLVVRGSIEDECRVFLGQDAFHCCGVGNVDGGAIETGDNVAAFAEHAHQLHAELSTATEDHRFFRRHYISQRHRFAPSV